MAAVFTYFAVVTLVVGSVQMPAENVFRVGGESAGRAVEGGGGIHGDSEDIFLKNRILKFFANSAELLMLSKVP